MEIKKNNYRILILKTEIPDDQKERALGDFFEFPFFHLVKDNVADEKDYNDLYRQFIDEIRFPLDYIEKMYKSRYVQHFYSQQEIERFRMRWTDKTEAGGSYIKVGLDV